MLSSQTHLNQCCHLLLDHPHNTQQGLDELLINFRVVLILSKIAFTVSVVEHSSLIVGQVDGVLRALEDQVAKFGAVARRPQGGQRQRMGGVVGKIEATLEAQLGAFGIDPTQMA